jgi:hypothetical protein
MELEFMVMGICGCDTQDLGNLCRGSEWMVLFTSQGSIVIYEMGQLLGSVLR